MSQKEDTWHYIKTKQCLFLRWKNKSQTQVGPLALEQLWDGGSNVYGFLISRYTKCIQLAKGKSWEKMPHAFILGHCDGIPIGFGSPFLRLIYVKRRERWPWGRGWGYSEKKKIPLSESPALALHPQHSFCNGEFPFNRIHI